VFRCLVLGNGGVVLQMRESPLTPELPKRLEHDRRIIDELGYEYFFDIADLERTCTPIPGVSGPDIVAP
jgi:hypothetical protein